MSTWNLREIIDHQQKFFANQNTFSYDFRIAQLQTLKSVLIAEQNEIANALKLDLHKPYAEALFMEILLVIDEIKYIIAHLKSWMRPQKTKSPFPLLWPGDSKIFYQPYGCVLVIAPWNFPFLLSFSPLIGAMCAGNCSILKPSEHAPHTQEIISNLIKNNFPAEYISVVTGGPDVVQQLLKENINYVFFTGGTKIGKEIMLAAAKQLIPVTLELGGKSPCIVDETANLDLAARQIIWSKMTNAGQVCIAPDYLFVHERIKETLLDKMLKVLKKFYGDDPQKSPDFGRIINDGHFIRLQNLLQGEKILAGGQTDKNELFIAPTILEQVSFDAPIMQEEIFGPILPVLTYNNLDEAIKKINSRSVPLALYLFSQQSNIQQKVINEIRFGGGCINTCTLHVANFHLPFGGQGQSGMGNYHGRYSFETFSHRKSIYRKRRFFDFDLQYPPYTQSKLSWLKKLMRLT